MKKLFVVSQFVSRDRWKFSEINEVVVLVQVEPKGLLHEDVDRKSKELRRNNIIIAGFNPKEKRQKYGSHCVH